MTERKPMGWNEVADWLDGCSTDARGRRIESVEPRRQKRGGKRPGVRLRISEQELRRLHTLHVDGYSMRALGRMIYRREGYRSPGSATAAITTGFKWLGLWIRTSAEATAQNNVDRGHPDSPGTADRAAYKRYLREKAGRRRRCIAKRINPPRAGERCRLWAQNHSNYCVSHDPDRAAEREANLAFMRERIGK